MSGEVLLVMSWVTLMGRGMYDGDHMNDGWAFVMGAFMIVVLIAVVLGVLWLARNWATPGASRTGTAPDRESAIEILDRRLASGEVTPEEYRERAEILRGR